MQSSGYFTIITGCLACLLCESSALAEPTWQVKQLTDTNRSEVPSPSLDDGAIAFTSNADLTGDNSDGDLEVFLYYNGNFGQITHTTDEHSFRVSLDAGAIAFESKANPAGENPDGNREIFLYHSDEITQITSSVRGDSRGPSLSNGKVAFYSDADHTSANPRRKNAIFLYDGERIQQMTSPSDSSKAGGSYRPSLDDEAIAFRLKTGPNNAELFLAESND